MKLKAYFNDLPHGSKLELANKLGITKTWLSLIISGRRKPSAALCNLIEKKTKGEVTRQDLRPDIFRNL